MSVFKKENWRIVESKNPPASARGEEIDPSEKDDNIIRNWHTYKNKKGHISFAGYRNISSKMRKVLPLFFSFILENGAKILYAADKKEIVDGKHDFENVLLRNGHRLYFTHKYDGISVETYIVWVTNYCKKYNRATLLKEITSADRLTLFTGTEIIIKRDIDNLFRNCMSFFTFKRDGDLKNEYRFMAALLSGLLGRRFDGAKPLFAIIAESQSSGKSTVALSGVKMMQGFDPIIFTLNPSKDAAQLSSLFTYSNRYILIDNIRSLKTNEINTMVEYVTMPTIQTWMMRTYRGRVKNNKTILATFNRSEAILYPDISARILTISMDDSNKLSTEDRNKIDSNIRLMLSNREPIMSDLYDRLNNINLWQQTNYYIAHEKFSLWAMVMSNILKEFYPEVSTFDFGKTQEDRDMEPEMVAVKEFLDHLFIARQEATELLARKKIIDGTITISTYEVLEEWNTYYYTNAYLRKSSVSAMGRIISRNKSKIKEYIIKDDVFRFDKQVYKPVKGEPVYEKKQQRGYVIEKKKVLQYHIDIKMLKTVLMNKGITSKKISGYMKLLNGKTRNENDFMGIFNTIIEREKLKETNIVDMMDVIITENVFLYD